MRIVLVETSKPKWSSHLALTHSQGSLRNDTGGWGEDFTSCFDKQYAKDGMKRYGDQGSGVVPTAWALLALMDAECDKKPGPLSHLLACFHDLPLF